MHDELINFILNDFVIAMLHFAFIALVIVLHAAILFVFFPKHTRFILSKMPTLSTRMVALIVATFTWFAASKYGPEPEKEQIRTWILWALDTGIIKDPTGSLATKTEADTVRAFAKAYETMSIQITSNLNAQLSTLIGITNNIFAKNVAYIAADIPRSMPNTVTNHNLCATMEATAPVGTSNQNVYVWFSEALAVAPITAFDACYGPEERIRLKVVTNNYPNTVNVNGAPCVVYQVEVPESKRGIPLRPVYTFQFGGSRAEEYLSVSRLGVSVTVDGQEYMPKTGTNTIMLGDAPLTLIMDGGAIVEAIWYGTNYVGNGEIKQ